MTINHKDSVNFNNLSIDTRLQKLLQTYILQKNPPNAYRLDSLFQVTLSKERIGAETAIRYINNKTQAVVDSRPNAKLYTSTYALEDINLGVQEEVTIQAFVKIPPQYIIQRGKWVFLIATLSIACVTILLLIAVSVQQKAQTVIDPATGFCELSKRYRFDRENAVLYDMENPVGMSHQSARLLQLFINSPNYYLDHEFMEVTLWGSTQLQSNRREQAIARLRKSLEKKPALHIINAWGNGYQLVVGPWWNAKRVEQLFRHISRSFIKH